MQKDYLIDGKPMKVLTIFALPMIIGNLFQQLYTMVDSAIVGQYVSEQALAAVGASYSLTNVFVWIAVGGGIGASVLVSRYFGSKEYGKMKTAMYTAMLAFLGISILLGILGLVFGKNIMIALRTPYDVLELSVEYLRIYFLGLPFLFMYNVLSSMFNALGKSRIPLYFLIFSSLFNIVLDFYMVTALHMGVAGVAWATLIAQGISAVMSFIILLLELKKIEGVAEKIFDYGECIQMAGIALPSILQQSTVSIGMMLVQSVVNTFGSQALAGFSAGMRVESLCIVPMNAISSAMSPYVAQNIGANKKERVVKGYHAANRLVIFFAVIICLVLEMFARPIITLFLGDKGTEVAMTTGINYLTFMGWFFCLIGFKMAVDGLLRGAGDMKMFTIANLANLTIRVVLAFALAPQYGIQVVWMAVPVGWFVNWLISYLEYRTGKWRKIYKVT